MKILLAIGAALVLWGLLRDRRTPAQRLADAEAGDDLEDLDQHLPEITLEEAESLGWRLGEENPALEAGSPEWNARWQKAVLEERRQKYRMARHGKVTRCMSLLHLRSLAKERNKREKASTEATTQAEGCAARWKAVAHPLDLPWDVDVRWASSAELHEERLRDRLLSVTDPEKRAEATRAYDELWNALRRKERTQLEMYWHAMQTETQLQRLVVRAWVLPTVVVTVGIGYWLGSLANLALMGVASGASLAVISAQNRFAEAREVAERNIAAWEEKRKELTSRTSTLESPSRRCGL